MSSVNGSDEEDSLMVVDSEISVSNEIEETSNECKGGEEEDLIIRVSENEDVQEDVDVTESVVLNLNNEYPTDRGILPSDVKDPMRLAIIEHGPCRPQCSLSFANDNGKTNFIPSYYTHRVGNIEIPRQWLCYSPSLNKPYCETCWLFAERDNNKIAHRLMV